jgi:SAM-dependent methyltransferase
VSDVTVQRYFRERYPRGPVPWFRAGAEARRDVIRGWLTSVTGHVLDVGTGDGRFLADVLPPRVDAITLIDLAPRPLAEAAERLAGRAAIVRTVDGDVEQVTPPVADVVIALGISDYLADWAAIVDHLRGRARELVIIDFPRGGTVRTLARRMWLHLHDVTLHTGTHHDVHAAFGTCEDLEVVPTRLHWIARAGGTAP